MHLPASDPGWQGLSGDGWLRFEEWLADVGAHVFRAVPFELGLIGEEVGANEHASCARLIPNAYGDSTRGVAFRR